MPEPSPDFAASRDELRDTYARRFAGHELRRKQVWEVLNRHFFEQWVKPDHSVLDLGAGYCEFINSVRARRKFALDLNPNTSQQAAAGVQVISQDITRQWAMDNACVDVVFTSNFLEHLPAKKDLTHCLSEASRILKPGGRFIALGPNIRFAFREYWDFFDHYLPLSDRSLVEALEVNGFCSEVVIPKFLPYTMKGSMPAHPALVRLYISLPLAWRFLGRQFLVVASKV
jgi:SAM-dependent methyltransferase